MDFNLTKELHLNFLKKTILETKNFPAYFIRKNVPKQVTNNFYFYFFEKKKKKRR